MSALKLKKMVAVMGVILSSSVMAYGDGDTMDWGGGEDLVTSPEDEKRIATIEANSEGVFMNSIRLEANRVSIDGLQELFPPVPENRTEPLVLVLCPDSAAPQWEICLTYKVGGVGPAGGLVFYSTSGGTHGLEAAPEDQGDFEWGCDFVRVEGTSGLSVGSGAANTKALAESDCKGKYEYSGEIAARVANNYELNGFDDWFLPSRGELGLMYVNLKEKGLGDFGDGSYWSSSAYFLERSPNEFAWIQYFGFGQNYGVSRFGKSTVRAIRSF